VYRLVGDKPRVMVIYAIYIRHWHRLGRRWRCL